MTKKPSYRFAGYTESWVDKKLGEYAKYRRGSFPQPYGKKEWYGGEDSMPFVQVIDVTDNLTLVNDTKQKISKQAQPKSVLAPEGTVIVTLQGSIGRVAITHYDAYVDRTLLIFESYNFPTHVGFWAYTIQNKFEIERKKAPGGTIKTITKEALSSFEISLPSLPEQTAIGSFFQYIDQLIRLQQRKLEVLKEQKKTYLKLLFPAKRQTKPDLRFAGFEDEWKEVKLGEVLTERNIQMVPSAQVPLVSFTVENGVTPKTERYNREFLVREESKKYKYTRYNDIVYNPANLKFGAIARNKYGEAVFSPIYVTFEVNYSNILPEFIEGILTSKDFIQQALKFQEGTVYERMAVKADDFTRLAITVPSLPEQEAIGSFFQDLDKAIAKQEEKVNQLKESKQTLLRKMFI